MRHQPNGREIGSSLVEIALTLTLLIAAALVLKSFSRLQALSLGYEPRGMLTARLEMPWQTYNTRDKIDMFAQDVARQSAHISRCAKRGDKLERAADGWMANWILARRETAAATFRHVERRSRSCRGRLFFDIQSALLRGRHLTNATRKIRRGSSLSIKRWRTNIFRARTRSENV